MILNQKMDKKTLKGFFRNKRILITGHTGFKGSWLAQMLSNWEAKIVGYALEPNTNPNLFNILNLKSKIKNYFGDIRHYGTLLEVMKKEKPEIVFHLAAQPLVREGYDDPLYTYETNIIGTANMLQAIKESGTVKSAIMVTTDKVYENKEGINSYKETDELGGYDPYSTSKVCAEFVIKSYIRSLFNPDNKNDFSSTLVASTRAGNVIGGGDWSKDRLIPDIVKAAFEGDGKIILRNPRAIRPWQYILEPLLGYIMLSMELYNGNRDFVGAWNFAPEDSSFIEVETLVKKAIRIIKKGNYSVIKDPKKHETAVLKLDSTKAKKHLNWEPVLDIDEALSWTFDWYKKYYENQDIVPVSNKQIELFLDKV